MFGKRDRDFAALECLDFLLESKRRVRHGLALLTQPAVAALYGYGVFGEVLTPLDSVGMMLLGGALVLARGSRPATS